MRLLLLAAYAADSHRRFLAGFRAAWPQHHCTTVTLPPRYFAWRAQGNALAFAARIPPGRFDRVLATGPVDLATLRGLRPDLARVPMVLYLHENEFAYPAAPRERGRLERCLRQVLAMLAADRVLVNSFHNRRTLLDGAGRMLAAFPDAVPPATLAQLEERLAVEPVPLEDTLFGSPWSVRRSAPRGPVHLVWNHRWEWDKGPDRLPAFVDALTAAGVDFRLHLLGRCFRRRPASFAVLAARLPPGDRRRGHWGRLPSPDYRRALREADLVLSTALHEFQGLAVQEAVVAGALPCVPERLAYPEYLPSSFLAPSRPEDPVADGRALAATAVRLLATRPPAPRLDHLAWRRRRAAFAAHLEL